MPVDGTPPATPLLMDSQQHRASFN